MSAAPVQIAPSPMGLGDVFTTTFSVFRRRTGAFLGLAALQQLVTAVLVVVPMIIAMVAVVGQIVFMAESNAETIARGMFTIIAVVVGVMVVASLVAGVISLYFTGLMITVANEATEQRFPTVTEARVLAKGFVWRFAPVYVIALVLYAVGVLAAMLPMLAGFSQLPALLAEGDTSAVQDQILATMIGGFLVSMLLMLVVAVAAFAVQVKFAYVMQVCALERLSGMAALRRAWQLTHEAFWRTLGYLLIFGLAAGAAQQVVSVAGQAIMSIAGAGTSSYSSSSNPSSVLHALQSGTMLMAIVGVYAVMAIVQLLIVPMKLVFVTVMYGDQVRRRELGPVNHAFGVNVPGQYPRPAYAAPAYGPVSYGTPPGYGQPTSYGPPPSYPQTPPPPPQAPYSHTPYGQQPTGFERPPAQD